MDLGFSFVEVVVFFVKSDYNKPIKSTFWEENYAYTTFTFLRRLRGSNRLI